MLVMLCFSKKTTGAAVVDRGWDGLMGWGLELNGSFCFKMDMTGTGYGVSSQEVLSNM
jgi:hypothetical protein